MTVRKIPAWAFMWSLFAICAVAQDEITASFLGRVFADGRPVSWMLQVRLERQDSSIVAYGYTLGTEQFWFQQVPLRTGETYYLCMDEPGYRALRYKFDVTDLRLDPVAGTYFNKSMFLLELESLPKEGNHKLPGSKVLDARQALVKREYDLANEDFARGQNEAALIHLEKIVELTPKDYDTVNKLGSEYLKLGQFEKAEAMLTRARDLNPGAPLPQVNLGILYMQQGDKLGVAAVGAESGTESGKAYFRKAVEAFEEAVRLDSKSARANSCLGTALYKVGDYEKAEAALLNALALDDHMQEAHLALLGLYILQRRYDAALEAISAFLQTNPDAPQRERVEKIRAQIESNLK
jgi:Flp pilus assembly protein TadD